MTNIEYALHIGDAKDNDFCDNSDWFSSLSEAVASAFAAIRMGVPVEEIQIQCFDTDTSDCVWDFPITFDENGAWSEDENALDELQGTDYTEEMILSFVRHWKIMLAA